MAPGGVSSPPGLTAASAWSLGRRDERRLSVRPSTRARFTGCCSVQGPDLALAASPGVCIPKAPSPRGGDGVVPRWLCSAPGPPHGGRAAPTGPQAGAPSSSPRGRAALCRRREAPPGHHIPVNCPPPGPPTARSPRCGRGLAAGPAPQEAGLPPGAGFPAAGGVSTSSKTPQAHGGLGAPSAGEMETFGRTRPSGPLLGATALRPNLTASPFLLWKVTRWNGARPEGI